MVCLALLNRDEELPVWNIRISPDLFTFRNKHIENIIVPML